MMTPGFKQKKPGSPRGRKAGYGKDFSLSVAEGKSLGLWKKNTGNMAEFVLPTALLGLIVVGSMVALLNNGNFAQTGVNQLFLARSAVGMPDGQMQLRILGENPFSRSYRYTTESGAVIHLPSLPSNIVQSVEVDGTHGTSERLLQAMRDWIDALVRAGEVTPEQGNLLRGLANQGHLLSENQRVMEEAMIVCGTDKQCAKSLLKTEGTEFEALYMRSITHTRESVMGQTDATWLASKSVALTAAERALIMEMGDMDRQVHQNPIFNYDPENMLLGHDLADFVRQIVSVKKQVPLSPANEQMLTYLTGHIFTLTNATASGVSAVSEEFSFNDNWQKIRGTGSLAEVTPEMFRQQVAYNLVSHEQQANSNLSHAHSKGICHMGDGKDDGKQCQ